MAHTKIDAAEINPSAGPHPAASRFDKDLGQALDIGAFGIYQAELPPGAETVRHDHLDDRAEDMQAVVRGAGVVVVDDEEVPAEPGHFIAVTPESARQVRAGDTGLVVVAVCTART